jgi:adenosylmethionine-8-amino-7-oxononanoate aminotransferase
MAASPTLHFDVGANLPKIAYGRGAWLYDADGRAYLDGSGGPALFSLGHAHPEVNEALRRQLDLIAHGYRYDFTSEPLEELTELIKRQAGPAAADLVFVSGGSEAVESALKLALQYQVAIGQARRCKFISRRRSWHGNTLGALSVSEFSERQEPFKRSLLDVTHLSPANVYRPPQGIPVQDIALFCAEELGREIERLGSHNVAAFIFEPVVGAAGGVVPAPPGYAAMIRDVCERHGVVMIADEVMCGAGRCGTWRALEEDGVVPDITAIAKGLGGGYVPLGVTIFTHKIAEAIDRRNGGPLTGHTFTGHTLGCVAGLAVQKIVIRDRLVEKVAREGAALLERLRVRLADIPAVGDVRGRGFFIGIEFVTDRLSKTPIDPAVGFHILLKKHTRASGLICYPCSGNVDGRSGDTVILAPPFNILPEELDELVLKLDRAIRLALNEANLDSGS